MSLLQDLKFALRTFRKNPGFTGAVVFALLVAAMLLSACAALPSPQVDSGTTPSAWQAPLPHEGRRADLARWWEQFDDPLLARLIDLVLGNARASFLGLVPFVGLLGNLWKYSRAKQK